MFWWYTGFNIGVGIVLTIIGWLPFEKEVLPRAQPVPSWDYVGRPHLYGSGDSLWLVVCTKEAHEFTDGSLQIRTSLDGGETWQIDSVFGEPSDLADIMLQDTARGQELYPQGFSFGRCANGDFLIIAMMSYVGTTPWGFAVTAFNFSTERNNIYRSTDLGVTWALQDSLESFIDFPFFDPGDLRSNWTTTTSQITVLSDGALYHTSKPFPPDSLSFVDSVITGGTKKITRIWRSVDDGYTWTKIKDLWGPNNGGLNEAGIAIVDSAGTDIMVVMNRAINENNTWVYRLTVPGYAIIDSFNIRAQVENNTGAMQQPRLWIFPDEPRRIYCFARNRILESTHKNSIWWSDDYGKNWTELDLESTTYVDGGYVECVKISNGNMICAAMGGTSNVNNPIIYKLSPDTE